MPELQSKIAIIAGASRGIGAACARELARQGAAVVLAARDADGIETIAAEINAAGGQALAVVVDVAVHAEVARLVERTLQHYGGVDILINNAGVIKPIARLAESDPQGWSDAVDINLKGVYYGVHAVLPTMLRQGKGIIVNLSSGAATHALEGWSHYCAAKAAVLALTRCTHAEYAAQDVRVFGLSPGTVATDMQVQIRSSGVNPVSRLDPSSHIPPEWVAQALAWLCTEAAADLAGDDISLRDARIRKRMGLPLG